MDIQPGHFLNNLLIFGRLLRSLGLDVDSGRMLDLVQSLAHMKIEDKTDFYFTLRGLLVHRHEDIPIFDKAFELFWKRHGGDGSTAILHTHGGLRRSNKPLIVPPPLRAPEQKSPSPKRDGPDQSEGPPVIQATSTYSSRELLRKKDFAELNEEELAAIKRLLAALNWQFTRRRSRRYQPGKRPRLDLRHMLRSNLQYGGEMLELEFQEPRFKPRSLVIIADISGSMERYSRLLLHFAYSLSLQYGPKVETYVFSTRLTRITRQLRGQDIDRVLEQISQQVPDWSGGTRIGEALKQFNFTWARRVLSHGAVVLLISDGWDRGDASLLRAEIARLQRSCYRLIWLNPLLGSESYEPLTRGMQTALPFIDDFLPVHNLASLEGLAAHLQRIEKSRPTRRQITGYSL